MINETQVKNMARITKSEMRLETVDHLIELINETLNGKKNLLNYANENQLMQDRAHISRLTTPNVLFIRQRSKTSIIPLNRDLNSIEQMTNVLHTIKNNQSMTVSFMIIDQQNVA